MSSNRAILFSGVLIAGGALAAYHNTFSVPFLGADIPAILENASIRQLWPLSVPLSPPETTGIGGRPVLNLSLALNHAISGTAPWSYHVVNLLIHLTAGLVLFGLVRRVLPRVSGGRGFATPPVVGKGPDRVVPPYHLKVFATPVACAVALLWTLHPLQTQAVTHIAGRAESLMGLFYLLTIYGFVRMAGTGEGWRWGAVSVMACLLAAGTHEAAVTAPVFVLLADRVFFCDRVFAALRRRPAYYLALAATWVPLVWAWLGTSGGRGGVFRGDGEGFVNYWLTQPEALTRYLGLALWPHPLVFDYGAEIHPNRLVMVGCALVMVLFVWLTVWLWWRRRPEALGLGTFLLLLAPTTLWPWSQFMAEQRMYLPLAGLLGMSVAATTAWVGRRGLAVCFLLALAGGVATAARNADYQNAVRLWSDTVQKRPANARAHEHLGNALLNRGDAAAAVRHYEQALRLDPTLAAARERLGRLRTENPP